MFNRIFTIKKIKKLRNQDVDKHFLATFRNELADHVSKNPVMKKIDSRLIDAGIISKFTYFNKLNFKLMPVLIIALMALITTGGGVAAASQTSLPNDVLYPVKILTEEVREAVTFNSETKVRLHARYAEDRIEEVQKMLGENGVDAKGLDVALANLKEHTAQAAEIIEEQRGQGKNVTALAKEVQSRIEKVKNDLDDKLASVTVKVKNEGERDLIRTRAETAKGEIERNENRIGKSEEFKKEAEEAIVEAQKQLAEAVKSGLATTTELIKFNAFMEKASTSLSQEHWVQARQHAKQAEKALEKIENQIKNESNEDEDGVEKMKKQSEVRENVEVKEQVKTQEQMQAREQVEVREQVQIREQVQVGKQDDSMSSGTEKIESSEDAEDAEDIKSDAPVRNRQ